MRETGGKIKVDSIFYFLIKGAIFAAATANSRPRGATE